MFKKLIRYFGIASGTAIITSVVLVSFVFLRSYLDSYTEVESSVNVPKSDWVIENHLIRSHRDGTLGSGRTEIIAINTLSGEHILLLTGGEMSLSIAFDEKNQVIIDIPAIYVVNIKQRYFGNIHVIYHFVP